ncbi:MAG: hypothetical protein J5769_05920 [Bacteroidales bacterium]|nr:hypothetical protein [Bacteroidales bacterium]
MKWPRVILLFLLLVPTVSRAQMAYDPAEDPFRRQEQIEQQGLKLRKTGIEMAVAGGASMLAGGALIGLGYYAGKTGPQEENMAAGVFLALGMSSCFGGVLCAMAGVPLIVSGNAMHKCDGYWKDQYYTGNTQRGFGLILDGGFLFGMPSPCVQARIVPGYYFNQHLFAGIGAAPTMDFSEANEFYSPFTLPVFADVRYCFGNKLFAPYLGAGVGMETVYDPNVYFSVEAGLRVRLSQASPRSFWVSALGETSAAYARAGIKMGYSF